MVSMRRPSQVAASVMQASCGWPSTSTVQAPHSPPSQPCLVPVRPSVSRSTSSSSALSATACCWTRSLTFRVSSLLLTVSCSSGPSPSTGALRPPGRAVDYRPNKLFWYRNTIKELIWFKPVRATGRWRGRRSLPGRRRCAPRARRAGGDALQQPRPAFVDLGLQRLRSRRADRCAVAPLQRQVVGHRPRALRVIERVALAVLDLVEREGAALDRVARGRQARRRRAGPSRPGRESAA